MSSQQKSMAVITVWSLLHALLWTSLNFPAVMSVDSLMLYQEALSGRFSGQHSVFLGLILRAILKLAPSHLEVFTFLQAFSMFFVVSLILRHLLASRLKLFYCSLLGFSFFTPLWIYSVTWWKDSFFALQLCLVVLFTLRFWRSKSLKDFVLLNIFMIFSVLSRHNAVLLVPPTFLLLLFLFFGRGHLAHYSHKFRVGLLALFFSSNVFAAKILYKVVGTDPSSFQNLVFLATYAGWTKSQALRNQRPSQESFDFWNSSYANNQGYERITTIPQKCGDEWNYIYDENFSRDQQTKHLATLRGGVVGLLGRFLQSDPKSVFNYTLCNHQRLTDYKDSAQYWFHLGIEKNNLGLESQPLFPRLYQYFRFALYYSFLGGLSRHYVYLFAAALGLFVWFLSLRVPSILKPFSDKGFPTEVLLVAPLFSLSYYATFLVMPAATDWRYLFPSTLLTALWLSALLLLTLDSLIAFVLKQRNK